LREKSFKKCTILVSFYLEIILAVLGHFDAASRDKRPEDTAGLITHPLISSIVFELKRNV
jgi:hypothetical protein